MHFITGMYSLSLYITTCHARDGVSDTPDHSNDIYLPSSSLIGDTDTVAWLRATRCTGTRPHRASQAPIVCTASLHATPPFQAAKSKALLVLSGRGAAVALVAARRDLCPSHLRAPCALHGHVRTLTAARARAVRVQPCHRILEATTMRRTAGIENKMRTRVERREKPSDLRIPYWRLDPACRLWTQDAGPGRRAARTEHLTEHRDTVADTA